MRSAVRKRNIAVGVLVLCVLFGSFFGCVRSVAARYREVMESFTNGDGIQLGSVASDLDIRAEETYNLVTVAKKYLPWDDADVNAARVAAEALKQGGDTQRLLVLNRELTEAASRLNERLLTLELSEADEGHRADVMNELKNRLFTMSHDKYNALAEDFNNHVRGVFPANVICPIAGIEEMAVFSEN